MNVRNRHILIVVLGIFAISMFTGCAGMEYAPKEPSILWYYPKELPEADRAVEDARKAGKDKECPEAFNEAANMRDEAYKLYWACRDKEAIEMAKKATEKARSLCPPPPPAAMAPETPPPAAPPAAMAPAPSKVIIKLEDVYFDFDKATLTNAARKILDENVATLKANPSIPVQIEGHACAHGTEEYNMALGERRANSVKEYLVNAGISASRLTTISYGETRLAMPETPTKKNKESKEARANRRVHFEVNQ